VFDILHGQPLRIHPDSQYQFLHTDEVARVVWNLFESGAQHEIFNLDSEGLISPREIADLAGKPLDLSALEKTVKPRIVHVNLEKISKLVQLPKTKTTIERFIREEVGGRDFAK
jgi:nucleoside-diphosphate-sugar epimerase